MTLLRCSLLRELFLSLFHKTMCHHGATDHQVGECLVIVCQQSPTILTVSVRTYTGVTKQCVAVEYVIRLTELQAVFDKRFWQPNTSVYGMDATTVQTVNTMALVAGVLRDTDATFTCRSPTRVCWISKYAEIIATSSTNHFSKGVQSTSHGYVSPNVSWKRYGSRS